MKEYVIKQGKFYILEEVDGITRVEDINQASTFPSIENANKFCVNDLTLYGIKREHLELIELERITETRTLLYKDKKWRGKYEDDFDSQFSSMNMFNKLGVK